MAYKRLDFGDRYKIQEGLNCGKSIHKIAEELERSDSTIIREIKNHRFSLDTQAGYRKFHRCMYFDSCERLHMCGDKECMQYCRNCFEVCSSDKCPDYRPAMCSRITNTPYVCNGCDMASKTGQSCNFEQFNYDAKMADNIAEDVLKGSREGISVTSEEMNQIDRLVSPLLLNGQSLKAIYHNHGDDLPVCERTLYRYVDDCRLTARNKDLPRKIKFKTRYKHSNKRNKDAFAVDRTYDDYRRYMAENPGKSVVEMDTVIGKQEKGKVLLTLIFESCNFMIAILLPDKTQQSVIEALNNLCDLIGIELFKRLFEVTVTDRGCEFSNPLALECDRNGEIKTRVFYCDPYCSWQKPHVERNHEYIRQILPKGTSFDDLTQEDITLMMNHINSYGREEMNWATPYALAELLLGPMLLDALNFQKIEPDDIVLKPKLLKKNIYKNL